MDLKNELLTNKDFISKTLKSLIEQEFARIVNAGLVSKDECFNFLDKVAAKDNDQNPLLRIYSAFSNIKLAGDKLEEDKFYDLTSIMGKLKTEKPEKECECVPGECVGSDCPCEENCDCKNPKRLLVVLKKMESLIGAELEKIAYRVGRTGDHKTAYKIEKTLREIRTKLRNGSCFSLEEDLGALTERNKILISEAQDLFLEFGEKFSSADYFQFIKSIRAEMRIIKNNNPSTAAQSLRNKWNTK